MPHSFFQALVAVFLWYVVRFCGLLCVVVCCVFVVYVFFVVGMWWVFRCILCFLWVCCCFCVVVCLRLFVESGVGVFFSRRGEGDNLLDARCDSSEEEGGIAGASEPDRVVVVTGDSGICLVNVFHRHHVVPTPSHARKVLCWITCCSLRCAVRRATLFLVFSILGIVFPLTTDHLHVLSDDWPFGSK